ncbi:LuxR C-terminal-related transcriptional regulator [Kutzneria sp. NPDC052558]|uniref:helix-turn-helix transcriptional regulator n=1 Tax=Kutzneria sp. NPDC052558 TaxID=3364121 RepID=UPI0037C82710
MKDVQVSVCALDPITKAGVSSCLAAEPGLVLLPPPQQSRADVVVAAFERLSAGEVQAMRATAAEVRRPVVLLVNQLKDGDLLAALDCRVVSILPRAAAVDGRMAHAVRCAAAGGAALPPNLLGQLVEHAERLHRELLEPSGLVGANLEPRQVEVLRMMADGLDTTEIAHSLCCSERTVKKIISVITTRLRARSRPHAVAHAMRAGVI